MSRIAKLHPVGGNIAQGAIEVGAVALFVHLALGAALAEAGASNLAVGMALGPLLVAGAAVVVRRYLRDDRRGRRCRGRGALPQRMARGRHPVVPRRHLRTVSSHRRLRGGAAVCHDGRKVKLRAAPYDHPWLSFKMLVLLAGSSLLGLAACDQAVVVTVEDRCPGVVWVRLNGTLEQLERTPPVAVQPGASHELVSPGSRATLSVSASRDELGATSDLRRREQGSAVVIEGAQCPSVR